MVPSSVCQSCGACCASLRVSFYWSEADPALGGRVPPQLVEPVSLHLVCMAGTSRVGGRCVALAGEIGSQVACTIYEDRPSPCRDFGDEPARCDKARAAHGLPPLATALLELAAGQSAGAQPAPAQPAVWSASCTDGPALPVRTP